MNKELDLEDLPVSQKKILDASLHLFAKNGFHATTTSQIAKTAGVSEGTIYKYFKSKNQILQQLLSDGANELCKGFFIEFSRFNDLNELVSYIVADRLNWADKHYDIIVLLTNQFLLNSGKLYISEGEIVNPAIVVLAINRLKDSFPAINPQLSPSQIIRIFAGPLGSYAVQRHLFKEKQSIRDMDQELVCKQIMVGLTSK